MSENSCLRPPSFLTLTRGEGDFRSIQPRALMDLFSRQAVCLYVDSELPVDIHSSAAVIESTAPVLIQVCVLEVALGVRTRPPTSLFVEGNGA